MLFSFGCRKTAKNQNPTGVDSTVKPSVVNAPDPVDSMIGAYSGYTRRIHREIQYNYPDKYDTIFYKETITISKLNNDSFRLEKNYSAYGSWHSSTFKYSAINKYGDGSQSYFNSIDFRFLPQNDSLYLNATQSSKSGTAYSYSFAGKK